MIPHNHRISTQNDLSGQNTTMNGIFILYLNFLKFKAPYATVPHPGLCANENETMDTNESGRFKLETLKS